MSRFLAGLSAAALLAAIGLCAPAQDKKAQPKKVPRKERIVVADPEKVKNDADFATQGEYAGQAGSVRIGVQVVAKGDGAFDVKILSGGLPGAGWDGKTSKKATARRGADGTVTIMGKEISGRIAQNKLMLKEGNTGEVTLEKVHRVSSTLGAKAPAGALVLFGGPADVEKWTGGKITELSDGKFLAVGTKSKQKFGACKVHIEFRTPWMPNSGGQGRGNSGVYLQDRHELQVLDSFGLTGENNECGGFYQAHKPSVNMCFPPLSWQTYDIEFTPAVFDAAGKKTANARATVLHNGVKVHDNVTFKGPSGGGQPEKPQPGPFQLQNHGNPVVYNNIWVVEVK